MKKWGKHTEGTAKATIADIVMNQKMHSKTKETTGKGRIRAPNRRKEKREANENESEDEDDDEEGKHEQQPKQDHARLRPRSPLRTRVELTTHFSAKVTTAFTIDHGVVQKYRSSV